jgi:hypothetical protein
MLFLSKRFTGTTICTETLILDDTSCTNRYGFPILLNVGIDEHHLSQLVAFALIRNRTIEAFVDFLSWVKQYLCAGDRDFQSTPVPNAFVVDRHDGQFAALRQLFPRSRIMFCAKYLAGNIRPALGLESPTTAAFWNLIDRKIHEKEFRENLKARQCYQSFRWLFPIFERMGKPELELFRKRLRPCAEQGHADTGTSSVNVHESLLRLKSICTHVIHRSCWW